MQFHPPVQVKAFGKILFALTDGFSPHLASARPPDHNVIIGVELFPLTKDNHYNIIVKSGQAQYESH